MQEHNDNYHKICAIAYRIWLNLAACHKNIQSHQI